MLDGLGNENHRDIQLSRLSCIMVDVDSSDTCGIMGN